MLNYIYQGFKWRLHLGYVYCRKVKGFTTVNVSRVNTASVVSSANNRKKERGVV